MRQLQFRFEKVKNLANKDCYLRRAPTEKVLWTKPPRNFVKINTDVGVKKGTSFAGVVARNEEGKVLTIRAVKLLIDVPEVAEAIAVLQGLLLAEEKGWSLVWCESGSKNVMDNLNNPELLTVHWLAEGTMADINRLKVQRIEV